MTTAKYQITDFTTDDPATLKAKLDGNAAVVARIAAAYQCYANETPNMTVKVAAGSLDINGSLVENAIQTSGTITAPVTHPRIDRVVIDQITGVASIVTGAEAASPSAPAIAAGKRYCAQVALAVGQTSITNSNITDERGSNAALHVNGLDEDTTPDIAADYAMVWSASQSKHIKVLLNKVGSSTDTVARDQIALTNLRLMLNTAITTGALVQGKQWELATDEWGATSTNETYTAPGSLGYYTNPETYSSDVCSGGTAISGGDSGTNYASLAFNNIGSNSGTNQWVASQTGAGANGVAYIGYDFGSGITKTIRRIKFDFFNNGTNYGCTSFKVQYSDNGSSWSDAQTISPTNTDGWQTFDFGANGAHRYWRLLCNATPVNSYLEIDEIEMIELIAAPNITLLPPAAVSVGAAPVYMDCIFLYKDDSGSAVLGTDLTVELTGDGGTDWAAATLTTLASYDGTYSLVKARADISGATTTGTSLSARIKTLNGKTQRIAAPAIYAE